MSNAGIECKCDPASVRVGADLGQQYGGVDIQIGGACTCEGESLGPSPVGVEGVSAGWPELDGEMERSGRLICECPDDLAGFGQELKDGEGRGVAELFLDAGCECTFGLNEERLGAGSVKVEFPLPAVGRDRFMEFFRSDRINELSVDDRAEIFASSLSYIPDDFVEMVNELLSDYGAEFWIEKSK
jgi:hypothetical protein